MAHFSLITYASPSAQMASTEHQACANPAKIIAALVLVQWPACPVPYLCSCTAANAWRNAPPLTPSSPQRMCAHHAPPLWPGAITAPTMESATSACSPGFISRATAQLNAPPATPTSTTPARRTTRLNRYSPTH